MSQRFCSLVRWDKKGAEEEVVCMRCVGGCIRGSFTSWGMSEVSLPIVFKSPSLVRTCSQSDNN